MLFSVEAGDGLLCHLLSERLASIGEVFPIVGCESEQLSLTIVLFVEVEKVLVNSAFSMLETLSMSLVPVKSSLSSELRGNKSVRVTVEVLVF